MDVGKLFDLFTNKPEEKLDITEPAEPTKTAKEIATEADEEYFEIVGFERDEDNPANGAFELDWNQVFVQNLRREGYQGTEDHDVIDQYFTNVCRHVVYETFQKEEAMNPDVRAIQRTDLGDGKAEYE